MFYISTQDKSYISNFIDCLINTVPLSNNGGLFMPSFIGKIDHKKIEELQSKPFYEIAICILEQFTETFLTKEELMEICKKTYEPFGENPLSISDFNDDKLVDLAKSPTLSYKDYGIGLTIELVDFIAKKHNKKVNIFNISNNLDGPAIISAAKDKQNINKISILYVNSMIDNATKVLTQTNLNDKISIFTTKGDASFFNKLKFNLYSNQGFRESANITLVNELNFFHILGYVVTYFWTYIAMNFKPFCISIPEDSLDLGIAAYIAKQMGVPIKMIILGVEKNDFLFQMQNEQRLHKKNINEKSCTSLISNIPSNFERLIYVLYNANQGSVKRLINELYINDIYKLNPDIISKFNENFYVSAHNNEFDIRTSIYNALIGNKIFITADTTIAILALENAKNRVELIKNFPCVIFQTAHFSRNLDFINQSIGYEIKENIPWNVDDSKKFFPIEIIPDLTEIGNTIINQLNS